MHPTTLYLITVFFTLVTASNPPRDANDPCPTPNILEPHIKPHIHVGALNTGCPTDEHPHVHPSNTQLAPPQGGHHALVAGIGIIALVSVIWPLGKCLVNSAQNAHLARRAGRSQAVSGPAPEKVPPENDHPRPDDNIAKVRPLPKRSEAVATADAPPYPIPPLPTNPPTSNEQPDEFELNGHTTNPEPVAPRVHVLQKFVIVGSRVLRTWVYRSEQTVVCLAIRRRGPYSLLRSLHRGARDLDESRLKLEQCVFLFVGVDTPDHEDAENDIKYLQQVLQSPAHGLPPRYQFIYGPNVTRAKICETMRALIGEARALLAPRVFMMFTGTGDESNRVCLSNGETLSESDLTSRLSSPAYQPNEPTLSMFFDICRSAVLRLAISFQRIEMAWSCSMGELAYAIRLSKQEDKLFPRSIFLLAIFLAAHHTNLHSQDSHFFEAAFTLHINQLSEFIRFAYDKGHQDQCARCGPNNRCHPPVAQNPDLQYAGRAVTNLGMLIATHFPHHAREVFEEVDYRMFQGGFTKRLCPLSDPDAAQTTEPNIRRDGSDLNPRKPSPAKVRLASVEGEGPPQAYKPFT